MTGKNFVVPRAQPRYADLPGDLPGTLVGHTQHDLSAQALDISRRGMSVLVQERLDMGGEVWLVMPDRSIKLEVRYCVPEGDGFRCGLRSKVPWEDLQATFVKAGCAGDTVPL